jgi:hypothetical protein
MAAKFEELSNTGKTVETSLKSWRGGT